jgi:hypothetical protein
MRDALLRSGYLLESRVESQLREHWGYVEANATYLDPGTGQSREFDACATIAENAGPNEYDFLFGVLLLECINNPQPLVVLTKEPLVPSLHHEEVKIAGLPIKVPDKKRRNGWRRLSDFLGMKNYHHYCRGRVGTQFCSFVKKKGGQVGEWTAKHEDAHYDSFRKLCDVADYHIDKHFKSWAFGGKEHVNIELYYPIVVLQGELLDARETRRSVRLRSADHLQFRRSVATKGWDTDYQIDVVRERFLPRYLKLIRAELLRTAWLLRRRHRVVRSAIEKIVEEAKDADSPEQIRRSMDYSP